MGGVSHVKRRVVQSRDTILFFKLTVLHVRSLIRHDLNLEIPSFVGLKEALQKSYRGLLNNHFYFLKVIIKI